MSTTYELGNDVIDSMVKVEQKSKLYENIGSKMDPHYNSALQAIPIIKKFIVSRGLIVYGGTAIDYALRLHGDNIYPDELLDIPDLDFYSPDSTKDAYDLADILYKCGYTSARTIAATYVITMRVDIIDNHFLADISYVPPKLFEKLPYIEYDGIKIIDPVFQKIDMHSSLTFPFDNPPREVIFARWRKDIKRYNKLHKYYPTPDPEGKILKLSECKVEFKQGAVLSGFAAYGAIYRTLKIVIENAKKVGVIVDLKERENVFKISDNILTFSTLDENFDLVSKDLDESADLWEIKSVTRYSPYINIMRERIEGTIVGKNIKSNLGNKVNVRVISTSDSLVSIHRIEIDKKLVTIVSIQFLLMYFLVQAHIATGDKKKTFYSYYEDLLNMINIAETVFSKLRDKANGSTEDKINELITNSPFFPTTKVYGGVNASGSFKSGFRRALADLGEDVEIIPVPPGYYPNRGNPKPKFDYESSKYFIKDGRKL